MEWYLDALKNYANFRGRSPRVAFWMFFLFNLLFAFFLGLLEGIAGSGGMLGLIYSLALLVPSYALMARRLHDTGRSGWWCLIGFIPVIGFIILLVMMALQGDEGPNDYGPDPRETLTQLSPS